MLIFNNRQESITDLPRYRALAEDIVVQCVKNFQQYLDADVPCQKLTEGLEGLYYALASYFLIHNVLAPLSPITKVGDKRSVLFEGIWPTQQNHVQYGSQPDGAKAAKMGQVLES